MVHQTIEPVQTVGFENGDYRRFAPLYLGTGSDWIRPTARVTDQDPIAGEYSLQWTANDDPHHWALISNALHVERPVSATVSVRVDNPADEGYAAGLGFAESQSRAVVVRATVSGLELSVDAWDGEPVARADATLDPRTIYDLGVELSEDVFTATLSDTAGEELARLTSTATIEPNALGLYVHTVAGGDTELTFDEITVNSGPYRVEDERWARSPQFVVLPRTPDVKEDQGNWVGGQTVIDVGETQRMWYRIRNNEDRGVGFGLAESTDGLDWTKNDANPVLVPDHGQSSNEGISVLQVEDVYRAWYTINRDKTWHIVHATSDDGVNWADQGVVIDGYCKDPSVLYVDGTYYLYAIAPSKTVFSVYTSPDGREWDKQATYELGVHSHPGAYYDEATETFWLYAFAEEGTASPGARVRRASATDGISFDGFEPTWHDPPVGLDHRPAGGIDYGAFAGDSHGHLENDRRLLVYYQARHDYLNNRPGWKMAGDGMVVLGGRFRGLFVGVPTSVEGSRYTYHEFPIHADPVDSFSVSASDPITLTVEQLPETEETVAEGTIRTDKQSRVTVSVSQVTPNSTYALRIGEHSNTAVAEPDGVATFEVDVPASTEDAFTLSRR